MPTLLSEMGKMPVTLCHGDFHFSNLLWDEIGEPSTVWAVDWQRPTKGPAVMDVATLLGLGVANTDVRIVRQEYLPVYHSDLLAHGVIDYEYERFMGDYRYGLLRVLALLIGIFAKFDFARNDVGDVVRFTVGKFAAAAADAGCGELIS